MSPFSVLVYIRLRQNTNALIENSVCPRGKVGGTSTVGLHSQFGWPLRAISCHQFGNLFVRLNESLISLIG